MVEQETLIMVVQVVQEQLHLFQGQALLVVAVAVAEVLFQKVIVQVVVELVEAEQVVDLLLELALLAQLIQAEVVVEEVIHTQV
jgi:hypothetical protein|tara:strand:+ start:224 stop:475 length:252 start_codon:yes stop_codon:yes gene_type:complete